MNGCFARTFGKIGQAVIVNEPNGKPFPGAVSEEGRKANAGPKILAGLQV